MRDLSICTVAVAMVLSVVPACHPHEEHEHHETHKIVVTSPKSKDINLVLQYVCQIHSRRHIEICALEGGYLEEITIREGQSVKQGDLMFRVVPRLYQARLNAEKAELEFAQVEYNNAVALYKNAGVGVPIVSRNEVSLYKAKLDKAQAKLDLAMAELNFATIKAPFDGIVDRLLRQQGSLVKEGDSLTTLSDNSLMWVYFNVPEARYLDYMSALGQDQDQRIELVLANGGVFPQPGKVAAITAEFNNETGNIRFRADFPNPDGLLRHGQTGTVRIQQPLKDALVIPQRATFEVLDKRYVYVVDSDKVVHQRLVAIQHELEDIFVVKRGYEKAEDGTIKSGLDTGDKIILEGVRQVHEGEKLEDTEYLSPDEVLTDKYLKKHAE